MFVLVLVMLQYIYIFSLSLSLCQLCGKTLKTGGVQCFDRVLGGRGVKGDRGRREVKGVMWLISKPRLVMSYRNN